MGIIKGQNLRVFIGTKAVAFATSCTLHVSNSLEESSTKDSTNGWQEQEITGRSWDISVDALYSVDTDASGLNGVEALDLILADNAITVSFEHTEGTKNREQVTGSVTYTGSAIVNDISINAANRQNTSYTLQAQGNGALTKS
jgi:predicted secreted protein